MTILIRDIGKIPFAATPQAARGDLSLHTIGNGKQQAAAATAANVI
jgi:hypothetical protein